jgi:hypothetical protein
VLCCVDPDKLDRRFRLLMDQMTETLRLKEAQAAASRTTLDIGKDDTFQKSSFSSRAGP